MFLSTLETSVRNKCFTFFLCVCVCVCVCVIVLHLAHGHVVSRLLEARGVVVSVSHHDPDLVKDHRADQLVGALDLNHDGVNVRGGLGKRTEAQTLVIRAFDASSSSNTLLVGN